MLGCNTCGSPQLHSCGCKPKLDIWTRPQSMGRPEVSSCEPQTNSDCNTCNDPVNPTCTFNWSITPLQTTSGGTVSFNGKNFPPNGSYQVRVTGPQTDYYWPVTSDSAGVVLATLEIGLLPGSYQFTPVVTNCTGYPKRNSVSVVASGPIDTTGPCSCLGMVTVQPTFVNPTIYSGTQIPLVITVSNNNSCPATNITMPPLVLPAGLTPVTPIELGGITIAGNSSQTFTFMLNANNATAGDIQAGVTVPPTTVVYKCGGVTFFAGGGSTYGTIKSVATGNCNIAISQFSVAPLTVANGGSVTYTLKIKNTGTNPIVNMNLAAISLSSGIVTFAPATNLVATGINLAAAAEHIVTVTGTVTAAPLAVAGQHAHQILVNPGDVTATCSFGTISNQLPAATTLIING